MKIMLSKEELHQKNSHPRIKGKRCFVNGDHTQQKTHASFRHEDYDGVALNKLGHELGQGTLFPRHINAGHITWIENYIADQWKIHTTQEKLKQYRRKELTKKQKATLRKRSKITKVKDAKLGVRVKVKLNKFGIKYIGAFIVEGIVSTVFPEENTKGAPLKDYGQKVNKSSKRL